METITTMKDNEIKQIVKARTMECIDEAKRKMDALVNRAFLCGAVDIEKAINTDYRIPKAITTAILMTLASEYTNGATNDIEQEAENIYQML